MAQGRYGEWIDATGAAIHRVIAADCAQRSAPIPSARTVRHLISTGSLAIVTFPGSATFPWYARGYRGGPVTLASATCSAYARPMTAAASTKAARMAHARRFRHAGDDDIPGLDTPEPPVATSWV